MSASPAQLNVIFRTKRADPFTEYPLEYIASGAFGSVYKTVYNVSGKGKIPVAVKAITKKDSASKEVAVLNLITPHSRCYKFLPCLYEYFKFNGYYVLIEELIEGEELYNLFKQNSLTLSDKFIIMEQCLDAIKLLHLKKVYHNDLKPENIMYNRQKQAVVIDFGLACSSEKEELQCTPREGGTPHFWSPQRFFLYYYQRTFGRSVDEIFKKGDIYALGLIFFIMFNSAKEDEVLNNRSALAWIKHPQELQNLLRFYAGSILTETDLPISSVGRIKKVQQLILKMCSIQLDKVPTATQCIQELQSTRYKSLQ